MDLDPNISIDSTLPPVPPDSTRTDTVTASSITIPAHGIPWRAFLQLNFTQAVLLCLVILSLTATIALMHEDKIPNDYITWMEGMTAGLITGLTVSMQSKGSKP
jgi:hypothetical protein